MKTEDWLEVFKILNDAKDLSMERVYEELLLDRRKQDEDTKKYLLQTSYIFGFLAKAISKHIKEMENESRVETDN